MKSFLLLIVTFLFSVSICAWDGAGTEANPYLISNAADLQTLSDFVNAGNSTSGKYFELTQDIDLLGVAWHPIGEGGSDSKKFRGSFNGNHHIIYNFKDYSGTKFDNSWAVDVVGLFGYTLGAVIKNLGVEDFSITHSTPWCGTLAAYTNNTVITDCYSACTINLTSTGVQVVGGLVGKLESSSSMLRCFSRTDISYSSTSGQAHFGGLIGQANSATVSNCYATGNCSSNMTTDGFLGGLMGTEISSTVSYCYSTGHVSGTKYPGGFTGGAEGGSISHCYWDITTSGQSVAMTYNPNSLTATSLTTAQMQNSANFVGWDFTSTWQILGSNYPTLRDNPDQAMPVELSAFACEYLACQVVIRWSTATETGNAGFQIERKSLSAPAGQWEKIAFVEGHGNCNRLNEYSYKDTEIGNGKYLYRLKQIDNDGHSRYVAEKEISASDVPVSFGLEQNYPNPFNPSTTIRYQLPETAYITLKVYDVTGREVLTLADGLQQAGTYDVQLTTSGCGLSSGVYMYQLRSGSFSITRKLMLVK